MKSSIEMLQIRLRFGKRPLLDRSIGNWGWSCVFNRQVSWGWKEGGNEQGCWLQYLLLLYNKWSGDHYLLNESGDFAATI
jgi:hypothetical protein